MQHLSHDACDSSASSLTAVEVLSVTSCTTLETRSVIPTTTSDTHITKSTQRQNLTLSLSNPAYLAEALQDKDYSLLPSPTNRSSPTVEYSPPVGRQRKCSKFSHTGSHALDLFGSPDDYYDSEFNAISDSDSYALLDIAASNSSAAALTVASAAISDEKHRSTRIDSCGSGSAFAFPCVADTPLFPEEHMKMSERDSDGDEEEKPRPRHLALPISRTADSALAHGALLTVERRNCGMQVHFAKDAVIPKSKTLLGNSRLIDRIKIAAESNGPVIRYGRDTIRMVC